MPKNNPRLLHTKDCSSGLNKFKLQLQRDYNAHKTTRTSQAREFKFIYIIYVSAHGVSSQHVPIEEIVCATMHHNFLSAAHFYIYVALSTKTSIDAQQQEVYWKCPAAAISTNPRRSLIDLF